MKKTYMQPLAEVEGLELEQMIAASGVEGFEPQVDDENSINAADMLERAIGG